VGRGVLVGTNVLVGVAVMVAVAVGGFGVFVGVGAGAKVEQADNPKINTSNVTTSKRTVVLSGMISSLDNRVVKTGAIIVRFLE
jgi:hypothetical protein